MPWPCEIPSAPHGSHGADWLRDHLSVPERQPLWDAHGNTSSGAGGPARAGVPDVAPLPSPAPHTDLPGPEGSPRGSRGWRRSYCSSDPGSRSATGRRDGATRRVVRGRLGLPARRPRLARRPVPRLTEANAFPRASPELPADVPREPGGGEAKPHVRDAVATAPSRPHARLTGSPRALGPSVPDTGALARHRAARPGSGFWPGVPPPASTETLTQSKAGPALPEALAAHNRAQRAGLGEGGGRTRPYPGGRRPR